MVRLFCVKQIFIKIVMYKIAAFIEFDKRITNKILKQKNLENYRKSGKIYVSNLEKIIETFLSFFDLIKLLLINKNDDYIQHDHLLISEELNLDERI